MPLTAVTVELQHALLMPSQVVGQEEELYWLALKLVPGLGTRLSKKLVDRFRTPQAVFRASATELEGAGLSGALAQSVVSGCAFEDAATQQEKMRESGAELITTGDAVIRLFCARSTTGPFCCLPRGGSNYWHPLC